MRTEIAIISALALVLSVPVAFGEIVETKGQNYDLVENYFIGEAIWNSHPERIMDNGWKNYALTNTGEKVIFNTNAVGSFIFDKNSCSYSIYENGFNGQQVIPSVSAVASYLDNGVWSNLPVNDEACTVKVTEYEDGVFLTSTKVITTDLMENVFIDYTGTTQNFYSNSTNANFDLVQFSNGTNQGYFNGETRVIESFEVEKFVQELDLNIHKGFKETFKVWHDGNQELGISQTIHSGDSITIGETVIDIAELNGQSFDKQFIIDNQAEILAITDSVNYDFDTGIESLTNVNIIFEDNTYKVNMDYASGDFTGYLEIDPTFGYTNGVTYRAETASQTGSSCSTSGSGITSDRLQVRMEGSSSNSACYNTAFEFDISSLPTNISVSDTKFKFNNDVNDGSRNCDYTKVTTQPSTLSGASGATTLFAEINSGTEYVDNNSACTSTGTKIIDLGTIADNDLVTARASGQTWIAYGLTFNDMSRDSLTHSLRDNGGGDGGSIEITYDLTIAPTVAPTGLTASTGVPIELDWNTIPSSGDGGSAITAYNVYRSLEEYAQQDLPNNSANANGIDFTSNELLLHGIETTTDTPTATYSDFTGTWTTDSGNEVQASNGVVSVNMGGSNRNDYISFDLGTPLSDSWVLRFKQEATTNSFTLNSGNAGAMYVSLSDGTNLSGEHNDGGSVDSLMTRVRHDSTQWKMETFDVRSRVSGTTTSSGDAGQVLATGAQTYYVEMIKDGATTSVKYFDDSAFTSQVGTTKSVSSNSIGTNLQYLGVHIYSQSHSSGDFIAEVSEFEIYDGVTSTEPVTTVSLPDKSTNSIPITLGTSGGVSISGFDNTWVASRSQASVSGGTLSFNTQTDGTNTSISYDLGSPLSDTWSIKAKISVPSQGHNSVGYAQGVYFGLSSADSGTGSTVAQDFVGMKYMHDNIDRPLGAVHADDEHLEVTRDNMGSYGVQFGSNISANTVMYIEIERVSEDTYNVTHYSDSGYTSVVSTITVTMSVTPEGLQYIVFRNIDENVSQSGGETLTIEDISFEVAGSTSTTSTTGVISTGLQSPNLSFTDSNLPDNTDDFSVGSWVKLDMVSGSGSFTSISNPDATAITLGGGSGSGDTKIGFEVFTGHTLVGKDLTSIIFAMSKYGSVSGNGYVSVYDSLGNQKGSSSSTNDWGTLLQSTPVDYTFTWTTPITIANGDRIVVEGGSFNTGNQVDLYADNSSPVDSNTNGVRYNNGWSSATNMDIHFDATFNQIVAPSPQKLLGLNDVTFNVGTDSASVVASSAGTPYSQTQGNTAEALGHTNHLLAGQKIQSGHTLIGKTINSCSFDLQTVGSPAGDLICELLDSTGNLKAEIGRTSASVSNGVILIGDSGSGTVSANDIISVRMGTPDNSNRFNISHQTSDVDSNSVWMDYVSGSWIEKTGKDLYFEVTTLSVSTIISTTGLSDNTSTAQHYSFTRSGNDFVIYQNGASVATATDSTSLGANSGTVSLSPDGSINGATTGQTGKIGNSMSFDGSNDYIDSSVNIFDSSISAVTSNVWLKVDSGNTVGSYAFGTSPNDGNTNNFMTIMAKPVGGSSAFQVTAGTNSAQCYVDSQTAGSAGTWFMVTSVFDVNASGDKLKIYVNGVEDGNGLGGTCPSSPYTQDSKLSIGRQGTSGQTYYNGQLDEGAIWSRVLTDTEITALYNSGSGTNNIPSTDIEAYFDFDDTGSTLTNEYNSVSDYTTNIDGMIDEFFIDSSALTSTEIDHIYDRGDKGTLVTTTSASTTEYDDSSVVGGNTYYFSVAGVNAIGEGVAITPYVSGLAGTPPQSPTSVATTISSPDSTPLAVTLSWSAPTNVGTGTLTGFEIYRDGTLIDTVGLVTSYADTVSSVGTYVYSLKAISTHGTSGLSSTSSIDTPTAPPTPDAPTLGITSPDPSPFDVTVSWSAQSDGGSAITGYEVFRSATETGTYSSVGTVNDLDFTDTVPSIGTWYYKITSTNLLGTSGQSVSSNVATPNAPDAPSITLSIADTDAFPRTITATFVAPSNNGGSAITGYNLEYSEDDSSYTQIQSNINGSFDYTVASAGTHYFKAQAINNAGTGVLSTGYSIATPNAPDAPSITLAINDTDEAPRTITATFVAPSSDGGSALTGYNLFTSPDDSVFTQVATGVNGNFNSTVASAGTWYLMAQAVNNVGTSLNSTSVSIATPNTPDAPSLTLAINDPDNSPLTITSTFVAPSSDGGSALTGYNLYSSPDDSVYTPIAEGVNGNFNSTVASAGTWYFKSEAINNVGNGTLSSSFNIATPTIPDAPSITLSIDNPDPSPFDVTATFVAPSSDGGSALIDYNLYYSSDNVLFSSIVNATVTPFTYDVVTAGTHYFKAEVTNNVGTSLNSTSVSVATPTVPPAPASATSTIPDINTAPYGVTVTWTTPTATGGSALTEYNVYRQTGSGTFSLVATTTSLTLSDTVSSISDQDFTYKIHAVNNVGEGTAFVTTTVTTGDVPDAPVLSGTSGTTSLTWTTPASDASITGYKIFRDGNLVTTVSGNSHSDFTTISFGSTYVYTVKAVSFFGDSVSSNQFSTTPETEITGMIAQGVTGTGAVIDWDEPAYYQGQITNYEVYYSEITASVTTPTTSAGTTTNTYSNFAPQLDYDTTYIFGVKVISPLGNSGFSNYVTVTTSVDNSIVAFDPTTGGMEWFDIDSVNDQTVNVIEFQRETQNLSVNGTLTDVDTLQVAYPSWWDDMTCDVDYKFAQKTEQYVEGTDMTSQINSADANQQVIGFAFQDIDNEVIEVECAPQQSTQDDGVSGKYIMTQTNLSTGLPNIPLVTQVTNFTSGEYGTDGDFGAIDVVGLFVILVSMVGFNRVAPIVGVLISASMIFALSFFGLIAIPTVIIGVIGLVIFLAWGITRNR